ncbi:poly [ADP-ribose] polymerase 2-A isoform X2 [Beta vulgaris subsp. vulgaris]|uniref:poly [ADP-ribose] polymerase 2-A isoform X2 n=1 Tax=Beta vulgaris subsp. vulgaris TaxID=3555 RepID=UPI002036DF08|nr:poly [ADP-ribose] polymerase 2-A isoform X2 [Beta vulgaris subsp. vulgaris]
MASNMKVDELRAELSKRGLNTSGIKPTLVRRLDAAVLKENDQSTVKDESNNNSTVGKKRDREDEDENNEDSKEISAIDKFQGMSIQMLRKKASLRGISTIGTKKELVQRLSNAAAVDDGNAKGGELVEGKEEKQDKKVVEEVKKEKLVIATKKGSAVLDQWLPDHIKTHYHVLKMGDAIYDAMLNQTNVGDNNNKFYVLQVLEADGGGTYMVYNRWGRVGVKGQDKLFGAYSCRETAVQEFEQKFLAKTRNHWSNRKDFVSYPKYYTWLEMDYSEKDQDQEKFSASCTNIQPQESKLEQRVAKFISLICNIGMMRQQMMEIGYNAEKLPLGKLSKSTIFKGYDVLKRIADVIGQSNRKLLEQLSGEFYTVIPHDFGFKKMYEFVIDTPQKLKSKLEMVEALSEIELATKLLSDDVGVQDDPVYAQYGRLHCELIPVEVGSDEFSMIQKYTQNTHAKTHSNYTVDLVQIFRVSREGEDERYRKFANASNRMLLWHGSRLTNWAGILSQGLRIAPPEAPVTGYMFGKGVYFADMFSKSANYCFASSTAPTGVLLLCEVALGKMEELLDANYNADNLPAGKLRVEPFAWIFVEFVT